jgi:hypothetical protein
MSSAAQQHDAQHRPLAAMTPNRPLAAMTPKSLKQGIKALMHVNRIAGTGLGGRKDVDDEKKPMGPGHQLAEEDILISKASDNLSKSQHEELSLEDLATFPRLAGDDKEASLTLTDSASQLRPSIHTRKPKGVSQDSPRNRDEFGDASGTTLTTAVNSSLQGSDALEVSDPTSMFHNSMPSSPVAASIPVMTAVHPHSAPEPFNSSSTPTKPARNKFLGAKIKISALKNYVGAGLDLTSTHNSIPEHGFGKQTPLVPNSTRNPQEDGVAPTEPGTPAPKGNKTGKTKNYFRKSFFGFKNVVTGRHNNAPQLLEDDQTSSTDASGPIRPLPTPKEPPENTSDKIVEGVVATLEVTEQVQTEREEAKRRRREKQAQRVDARLKKSSNAQKGQQTHASVLDDLPKSPRKSGGRVCTNRSKLDAGARERLKKHSEENEFRRKAGSSRRRRELLSNSKHDAARDGGKDGGHKKTHKRKDEAEPQEQKDAREDEEESTTEAEDIEEEEDEDDDDDDDYDEASDEESETEDQAPAKKLLLRAPSLETDKEVTQVPLQKTSLRGHGGQQARKLKKIEDEKLRERVRTRQSFVKEPSFTLLDLLDGEGDDDDGDGGASFAEELGDNVAGDDTKPPHPRLEGPVQASSRHHHSLPTPSSHTGPSMQGSFTHVESRSKSYDYLQLVIDSVPTKTASPPARGEGAPAPGVARVKVARAESAATSASRPERSGSKPRKEMNGGSSRRRLEKDGSSRRVPGEEKGRRRPREKGSRHRTSSRTSSKQRDSSPYWHSEHDQRRRRHEATAVPAGHASAPILVSSNHKGNESLTRLDFATAMENDSSRQHHKHHRKEEKNEKEPTTEPQLQDEIAASEEAPAADSAMDESAGNNKSLAAICTKGESKGRGMDRKTSKTSTTSKHSTATSATAKTSASSKSSGSRKHREGGSSSRPSRQRHRPEEEGDGKKKPSSRSSRGQSEKRRTKRDPAVHRSGKRRHSLDAKLKKKPPPGQDYEEKTITTATTQELGKSLAQFNW